MAFPMGFPKHFPLRCGHQGLPCGEEEDAPAIASTGGEVLRLPGKTLERDVENPLETHGFSRTSWGFRFLEHDLHS